MTATAFLCHYCSHILISRLSKRFLLLSEFTPFLSLRAGKQHLEFLSTSGIISLYVLFVSHEVWCKRIATTRADYWIYFSPFRSHSWCTEVSKISPDFRQPSSLLSPCISPLYLLFHFSFSAPKFSYNHSFLPTYHPFFLPCKCSEHTFC